MIGQDQSSMWLDGQSIRWIGTHGQDKTTAHDHHGIDYAVE